MKRVLFPVLACAAMLLWAVPASSQASTHYGGGTVQFGNSDECEVTLSYEGDMPGSGTISDLALVDECLFGGWFPFEITDSEWEAAFDPISDAEMEGTFSVRVSSLVDCHYAGTLTGSWDGLTTSFSVDGTLNRVSGSFLCNSLISTTDLSLSAELW